MKVYRIANRCEIDNIIEHKSFKKVGSKYDKKCNNNSHFYKKNTNYMHFFMNKDDIFYLNNGIKRFICTYEIDDEILNNYLGFGKYFSKENNKKELYVLEFAIPSKLINITDLKQIEVINPNYNYFDFLENGDYNSTLIYKANENILKK